MSKKNILFIRGTADNRNVQLLSIRKDGSTLLEHTGSANIYEHIQSDKLEKNLLTFDTNPKQEMTGICFDAIFNQISDPDTHKITLLKVEEMQKQLPADMPFFNTPENIKKTTRDNIYKLLQGIDKLHVPKTVRIQPLSPSDVYDTIDKEGFEFPVIFRRAGDHGGISTILVENKSEQFYAFPLDGRDYYMTQFVEYSENGLYKKVRLMVIDGEVFTRGGMISDEWIVHAKNQLLDTDTVAMEKNTLEHFESETKPMIQTTITEIYAKLNLDYFGIDCHIDQDNNILVFEINANMNVLTTSTKKSELLDPYIKKIHQALIKMMTTRG